MGDAKATRVVQGAASIASLGSVGAIASALATIAITRVMGQTLYGEFTFLAIACNFSASVARLGTGLLIVRQFSPEFNEGRRETALGLYGAILWSRALSGLVVGLGVVVFLALFDPFHPPPVMLAMAGLLVLVFSLSETFYMLQWGALRYSQWGLLPPLRQLSRLFLAPAGFLLGNLAGPVNGVTGAVGGVLLGECLVGLLGWWLTRGVCALREARPDFAQLLLHKSFMLRSWLTQVLSDSASYLGPLLVGVFSRDAAETGFYGLATGCAILVLGVAKRGASSFSPMFGILVDRGDTDRLLRWASLAIRGGCLGFMVLWGLFGVLGQNAIEWTVGADYEPAYPLLVILLASLPFQWASGILLQLCNVHKRPDLNIWPALVQMAAYVGLGVWWLTAGGPWGLAGAYAVAAVVACGAAQIIMARALHLRCAQRVISLVACALPFAAALVAVAGRDWGVARLSFLALAATAATLPIAHFSGALRWDEFQSLLKAIRGKSSETLQ